MLQRAHSNQVRAALELQPGTTLVSLDGRSAYDTISRASFLTALRAVAPEPLPFVRLFYGQPSTYRWWDAEGCCRDIQQGEGCEQGDALAPALFSLGQHGGLEQASSQLQRGERLLAFLDVRSRRAHRLPPQRRWQINWCVPGVAGSIIVGAVSPGLCGNAPCSPHCSLGDPGGDAKGVTALSVSETVSTSASAPCRAKGVALPAARPHPFNASIARARCCASIEASSPLEFGGPGWLASPMRKPRCGCGVQGRRHAGRRPPRALVVVSTCHGAITGPASARLPLAWLSRR